MTTEHIIHKYMQKKIDKFSGRFKMWKKMKLRRMGLWK